MFDQDRYISLVEQWTNGNRNYVLDEIGKMKTYEAAAHAARIALNLGHNARMTFVRLLLARARNEA